MTHTLYFKYITAVTVIPKVVLNIADLFKKKLGMLVVHITVNSQYNGQRAISQIKYYPRDVYSI